MNIVILHGIGGKAGIHWQQWLCNELSKSGRTVIMPTLPNANQPDRKTWLSRLNDIMDGLNPEETVIIGHSLGVVTALDYLEHANKPIKALISVSGFSHPMGTELNEYFMIEKTIDFTKVNSNVVRSFVLFGDNDPYVNINELNSVAKDLNIKPYIFHNGGHLNTDSGYTEFPQLLNIINSL